MHNPEMYQHYNFFQKRDGELCLDKFKTKLKLKKRAKVIDLGCGDGSVTQTVLKKYLPDFEEIVGIDISEAIVEFANEKYGDNETKFIVMDIQGDLSKELIGKFDHVYSSHTLHMTPNKEKVFQNIYDLLVVGGTCSLVFCGRHAAFDIFVILAKRDKWREYMKNLDSIVFPYHYMSNKDTENDIRAIVEKSGFKYVDVQCHDESYVYEDPDLYRKMMESINFFQVPSEQLKEYMDEFMQIAYDIKAVQKVNVQSKNTAIRYCKIEVFGVK